MHYNYVSWRNSTLGENAVSIRIPDSTESWGLYFDRSEVAEVAASNLTHFMRNSLSEFDKSVGTLGARAAINIAYERWCEKSIQFSSAGANDTEVRETAMNIIRRYANARGFQVDSYYFG